MVDKKEQIINATISLFAQDGLSVPTAKIAKSSHVSNGTLFNYFATKQDLIDGVYLAIKENMAINVLSETDYAAPIRDTLYCVWRLYILWAMHDLLKHKTCLLLKSSHVLSEETIAAADEIFEALDNKIEQGIAQKEIIDVPQDYLCELVIAQLSASISYAESNGLSGEELDKHIDVSFEIHWNGIKR